MKNKKRNIKLIMNLICITTILASGFSIYHKTSNRITESDFKNIQQQTSVEYDTNSEKTEVNNEAIEVVNKEVKPNNEEIEVINKDIETTSYKYAIETEGNIDEELVTYIDSRLQVIPKVLREAYFNNGGKILVTDKNISKTYYKEYNFGNVIGLHDARKNIIYMSNSKYAVDNSLIHEFGHVLDTLHEWDTMNSEFTEIYNAEKDTFQVKSSDGHYKTNQREFFAEVLQEYILHPDTCKSTAPKAYEFVKNKIESLNQ